MNDWYDRLFEVLFWSAATMLATTAVFVLLSVGVVIWAMLK